MPCRDEHSTEENAVGLDVINRELRLERIDALWQDRCTVKYNKWAAEYNRRIDEMNAQDQAEYDFAKKFVIWKKEVLALGDQVQALLERFDAYENVTPADWDAIAAGKERKVFALVETIYPKRSWPPSVRYPNVVALYLYAKEEEEETCQISHEKQYRVVVEEIAQGNAEALELKRIQTSDKKQYQAIVKQIAHRDAATMELKRIADDISDGVSHEIPVTTEQVQQWCKTLRDTKHVQTDQAQFEKDVDRTLLARLQYQSATSQDWDVHAWIRMIFDEQG